jgi:hypothetical protein
MAKAPTDASRPRNILTAFEAAFDLPHGVAILPTAGSQRNWPVEPAANRQDSQLMRILS